MAHIPYLIYSKFSSQCEQVMKRIYMADMTDKIIPINCDHQQVRDHVRSLGVDRVPALFLSAQNVVYGVDSICKVLGVRDPPPAPVPQTASEPHPEPTPTPKRTPLPLAAMKRNDTNTIPITSEPINTPTPSSDKKHIDIKSAVRDGERERAEFLNSATPNPSHSY